MPPQKLRKPASSPGRRTAQQQDVGLGTCHEAQRTGGRHAQAFAAAQHDFRTIHKSCGGPVGDDDGCFILHTFFKTRTASIQTQQVGLDTLISKEAALCRAGLKPVHD